MAETAPAAPRRAGAMRIARSAGVLLTIGFLALLATSITALWLGERTQAGFRTALEARTVGGTAEGLRSALQAAESSQRGYLATGNQIYLAPYGTAKGQALRRMDELKRLLAGDAAVAPALERLGALVDEKLAEMEQTIALKRDRRDGDAQAVLRTNRGKALMDEVNVFLSSIVRAADSRLTEGVSEQRDGFSILRVVTILAAGLTVLVVGYVGWLVRGFIRDLARARDEVQMLNADLERRVEERTAELKAARDRAEVLLSEVNHRVANSLALVASMVGMQAREAGEGEARRILNEAQARILAVGMVHKKLYTSGDVRFVELDEFLRALLDQLELSLRDAGHGARVTASLEPVTLTTDKSVSLGVIVSEWVTNAFKYAYPGGAGEIRVRLNRVDAGSAELVVEDDGIGRSEQPRPQGTGLGTKLVNAMATTLGGRVEYLTRSHGTTARLVLPWEQGAALGKAGS